MEQYILISEAFMGKVIVTKDGNNLQANFTESSVTVGQQKFVLSMMQQGIPAMMEHFNGPNSDSKFEKLVVDFEMFWNRYDDKLNSSRKKTQAKWDKMPVEERTKAFYFVGKYFASIPAGTRKKYAETYLNAELWNN